MEKKKNLFLSESFLITFITPSILWLLISLLCLGGDKADPDYVSISDLILADVLILSFWFVLSIIIALIINKYKKNKEKKQEIVTQETINNNSQQLQMNLYSNEKLLYKYDGILDINEYMKMNKVFPQLYYALLIWGTIFNIFFTLFIITVSRNSLYSFISFITIEIFFSIYYKLNIEKIAEKTFNSMLKKNIVDEEYKVSFFNTYFKKSGNHNTYKIAFSEITKAIETNTHFYLYVKNRNIMTIIEKKRCSSELINFIKEKTINLNDCTNLKKGLNNKKTTKICMLLLFSLTILSPYIASYIVHKICLIYNCPGSSFTKIMWIFWLMLPIPITSIILGIKYKKMGLKCKKNIIAGLIVTFFLLTNGLFCIAPTNEQKYNKIYEYNNIINVELPTEGYLEIESYNDYNNNLHTVVRAYYNNVNTTDLTNDIKINANWIKGEHLKSTLRIFIPNTEYYSNESYYSIYNKTLNEYNVLPNKPGKYKMYVMKYDKFEKSLTIHEYIYNYK